MSLLSRPEASRSRLADVDAASGPAPRGVTVRSILLGSLLVALLAAWVPYQYVVGGGGIEGGYMPLAGFLAIGLFVVTNALLVRFAPHRRLGASEHAVVLAMILSACGVVNIGLFRQLPGNLVGIWYVAVENTDWKNTLDALDLPDWVFPTMAGDTVDERFIDPVVQDFMSRVALDDRSFANQWNAVPWRAWLTPAVAWGAFGVCLWGACLSLVLIFRRQWVENERLPFPIASIYLSLLAPPEPGRAFNAIIRARTLWIAFGLIYVWGILEGMHVYDPRHFPEIPQGYDFRTLFGEPPWTFTTWGFQRQQVLSFTMIAVTSFVTTKVSFSIWFFFVAQQAARMIYGSMYQAELTDPMATDQTLGAYVAYALAMLFVARHHLATVARQMIRGARAGEPRGRYVPYLVVGWAFVAFLGGMVVWLCAAGASLAGAVVISAWIVLALVVLARLVAETGLVFVVFTLSISRWFVYALQDLPAGLAVRTTTRTYFYSNLMGGIFQQDLGHAFAPQAATSLRIADGSGFDAADGEPGGWRKAAPFVAAMALAVVIAYVVAGGGWLHMQYNHAVMLDSNGAVINDWGTFGMPRWHVLNWTAEYAPPRTGPVETHSRPLHFLLGAGITGACGALRLRYAGWPLHPVGFILSYGWGLNWIWFSIFLGWLVKVIIVRFGGGSLLRSSRPFFIGLILGEAAAGLTWIAVSLVRLSMGLEYHTV
jgi:hypothetical protein